MRKFRFKHFLPKYDFTKRRRLGRIKNHPFVVPVITLLALLFLTGIVFVLLGSRTIQSGASDSHVVIVSYDSKKQTVPSTALTVGDLLKRLNIKLNDGVI